MDLQILEKKKDLWRISVKGENHSLLNLLRENAWASGAKDASYIIEHPYLSDPKIKVKSDNPKKTLTNAIQLAIDQATDFERDFKRDARSTK